VKGQGEAK